MSGLVLFENVDGVALVTLNRPEAMNALNRGLFSDLRRLVAEIDSDPAIKVVVVRGSG